MGRNAMWSFAQGRAKRLTREHEAAKQGIAESEVDRAVPLHSHDGTLQSQFAKGWHSVTAAEVYEARNQHRFNILTTDNDKAASHCTRLRALFDKDVPCSR